MPGRQLREWWPHMLTSCHGHGLARACMILLLQGPCLSVLRSAYLFCCRCGLGHAMGPMAAAALRAVITRRSGILLLQPLS